MMIRKATPKWISIGLLMLTLQGCSSQNSSKPAEAPVKATEQLTGRVAFQKLYVAAHGWAADAKPYRLESQATTDALGRDGKSAVWRASFGSAAKAATRPYMWSGSIVHDAPASGISEGAPDSYSANNSSTQVFELPYLKTDSDQAFEIAQKHGGEKALEKNPQTPVLYILEWERSTSSLIWYVVYGTSRNDAGLTIAVNASDGLFIRAEK